MNKKHQKTLKAIFANPVSTSIRWADVESLLQAMGANVNEGDGSRVSFVFGNEAWYTHRPHPEKEAKPYQIRSLRSFLNHIGVER